MIKVKMFPHPEGIRGVTGIEQVVMAYAKYLPQFDFEIVRHDEPADLVAGHVGHGATQDVPYVCHTHGLHWTADYECSRWQYAVNGTLVNAIGQASAVTVPSAWVAETFQRDMHFSPDVIPHGIDWQEWQVDVEHDNYVLYNKNRQGDVCNAEPVSELARLFPDTRFLTTFVTHATPNIKATGVLSHDLMQGVIQRAGVYLAVTKETFGIGILEAMASGVPVLGYAHGGILDLVQHGVNGYLAAPGNLDDLAAGLAYCQEHSAILGTNGRELARAWTWERAVALVANTYRRALQVEPATVAVIIPTYNYAHVLDAALASVLAQDYPDIVDIIVVDDGSDDNAAEVVTAFTDPRVRYVRQHNQGVAIARNHGISLTQAKYICCLDADDQLAPTFISTLVPALEADRNLGVAYTGLMLLHQDGHQTKGGWPLPFDPDEQVAGRNQVPTCCLYRRAAWERLGGYRQRYAPAGCGAEDAEFWLRITAAGYNAAQVTPDPLFIYRLGGRTTSGGFKTPEYLSWHPWTRDGLHPFASWATPQQHSHAVRQYDQPEVSVIIPVGPGHEQHVIEALDSLEAQTFRTWEAIVVWNTGDPLPPSLYKAYPFVNFQIASDVVGAGAARNRGAEVARAPYLLFLDADDWLLAEALEEMLLALDEQPAIIYSESLGLREIDANTAKELERKGDLRSYVDGMAVIRQRVAPYNYELAVRQPSRELKPYFWCYVSSLVPAVWHAEIGGFDEELEAWEDWDYWIRLAKAGKPFIAVEQPLMVYRYHEGYRREYGKFIKDDLMNKMINKHKGVTTMPCKGCGGRTRHPAPRTLPNVQPAGEPTNLNDADFVRVEYVTQQRGSRGIVGVAIFPTRITPKMRRTKGGWVFDYGYHQQGDVFLIHREDLRLQSMLFRAVAAITKQHTVAPPKPQPVTYTTPHPAPVSIEEEREPARPPLPPPPFDLQTIPGVTKIVAASLKAAGLDTRDKLMALDEAGLQEIKGIGPAKAAGIYAALHTVVEPRDVVAELERLLA